MDGMRSKGEGERTGKRSGYLAIISWDSWSLSSAIDGKQECKQKKKINKEILNNKGRKKKREGKEPRENCCLKDEVLSFPIFFFFSCPTEGRNPEEVYMGWIWLTDKK